ncbi:hypothetical protein B0A55_11371 [Friedmanniomyces simplex]|uniref:Velvet domain-containing protein n=1 Tax=Friedmanniomyces simplex TaxID=329884 RepID=A0A4U0WMR8_9PEZI|nr:hypothetical protein B0A55_11371 [Friedmanniomyces simplex]
MAAVGPPQTLPPPSFLGRPEQRHTLGPSLPAIHTLQSRHRESNALPPIHLPPLQVTAPNASSPFRPAPGQTFSIQQLLSHNPSPPHMAPHSAPVYPQAYPPPQHHGVPGVQLYPPPPLAAPQQHAHIVQRDARPPQMEARPAPTRAHPPFAPVSFGSERSPTSTSQSPSIYSVSPRSSVGPTATASRTAAQPPPFNYELVIRQQPVAARACGFGERDRRVIDPPPILELKITDAEGAPREDHGCMLALHCTLMTEDGSQDDTAVQPTEPNTQATRRLMGTLVASPYQAKDEHGRAGTFFVFPDLSCRQPGKYRLRLKLVRIDFSAMYPGMQSPTVAGALTDVFSVFTAKDFPGMRASSALLKALRRQGLNVGVKKGSEARKGKGKTTKKEEASSSESESEEDSEELSGDEQRRESTASKSTGGAGVSPKNKLSKKKPKRRRRES